MTSISKSEYINKLNGIVNENNKVYHRTIRMKPVDVKNNTYIDFSKKVNDKDPRCQAGDHMRNSNQKNIFAKGYALKTSKNLEEKK